MSDDQHKPDTITFTYTSTDDEGKTISVPSCWTPPSAKLDAILKQLAAIQTGLQQMDRRLNVIESRTIDAKWAAETAMKSLERLHDGLRHITIPGEGKS